MTVLSLLDPLILHTNHLKQATSIMHPLKIHKELFIDYGDPVSLGQHV